MSVRVLVFEWNTVYSVTTIDTKSVTGIVCEQDIQTDFNFTQGFLTQLKCCFVSVYNKCLNTKSFFNIRFDFDIVQYERETEGSSWQWRESWFTMQTGLCFTGLVEHVFKTSRNKDFFVDKDMSIKRTLCRCAHPVLWQKTSQPVKFRSTEQ